MCKAYPGPSQFASEFATCAWLTSYEGLGPISDIIRTHIRRVEQDGRWALLSTEARCCQLLVVTIAAVIGPSCATASTWWIGFPALPDQLCAILQARIHAFDISLSCPRPDPVVTLLGQIDTLAADARPLMDALLAEEHASADDIYSCIVTHRSLRNRTSATRGTQWSVACELAGRERVDDLVAVLADLAGQVQV